MTDSYIKCKITFNEEYRLFRRTESRGMHAHLFLSNSEEQVLQFFPELFTHKTVNKWVQTAVRVRQAHGHRKHIGMNDIVRLIPMHSIEFHQHAPKRYGVIGHPAEEERQDHDGDGLRDLRSSF